MKKFLVTILIFVVCFSMSTIAFAAEPATDEQTQAESIAKAASEIVGESTVNDNIVKTENAYSVAGDGVIIELPASGASPVITEVDDGEDIVMSLPKEVSGVQGLLTSDGTVVYNLAYQNVAVSVQALQENLDGVLCDSVRTLVTMKNAKAPNDYSFDFDLPEGYSLVKDYDYDDEFDEYDCGQIFVVDNQGESICTIDPITAKDANGEIVDAYYEINGTTLTQVVNVDENTVFPVATESASHPDKKSVYYLTKSGVKKVRDKYSGKDNNAIYEGLLLCASLKNAPVAGVATAMYVGNKIYVAYKYATWNQHYLDFEKKYAKVVVTFKWRSGGKNSGYYPKRDDVTYVSKK